LIAVVGLVCAQPVTPQAALAQVQQEEATSRAYLSTMLKLQHAAHSSAAATSYLAMANEQSEKTPAENRLVASYNLLRATIIKSYQIIFGAAQVQQEFYVDRLMQLGVQSAGQQVPPQILQLVYLRSYTSMLKTMKFSYALQVVSHFRTWLEDEIDAGTNGSSSDEELINDKLYAFNAYHMSTQIDLQLAYLEMYLNQAFQALTAPVAAAAAAPANATAFLEEEETAQPSQFFSPAVFAAQNPAFALIYKFYRVMFEYSAAQYGLAAANAEHQTMTGDEQSYKSQESAGQYFQAFAQNLLMSSQIEYNLATLELYNFYAPSLAGAGAGGQFFF